MSNSDKIKILLKHYFFHEICDIMGYNDESNETVATDEMRRLEKEDYPLFFSKMMEAAIINGNFEEVIENDARLPI
jgi:hypothetical protein